MAVPSPILEKYPISIVWLRRDLRLADNHALFNACSLSKRVCPAFVLSPQLLAGERAGAAIVSVFFDALSALRAELRQRGSDLAVLRGEFAEELVRLADRLDAKALFYNEDYEPAAIARDMAVSRKLRERGLAVESSLDHVYFGANEVCTHEGAPYRVFTPYKRRWLDQRALAPRLPIPSRAAARNKLMRGADIGVTVPVPGLQEYGFAKAGNYPRASEALARDRLAEFLEGGAAARYERDRDFPSIRGTSYLSPQLRAGTIGVRTCVEAAFAERNSCSGAARAGIETWISQLVWRDFYQMILKQFPHVDGEPFIASAARLAWNVPGANFEAWCEGRTGYPIVDAGMRQLNMYGWMHNRLRMIVASFLSKHLLIDWRKGERYFEQHLADADLAQNNGGWQWAASTGTDAAPYFRIFNPVLQSERFDPDGAFIKRMVPELESVPAAFIHTPWKMPPILQKSLNVEIGARYPSPIVDHASARVRAIAAYKSAMSG